MAARRVAARLLCGTGGGRILAAGLPLGHAGLGREPPPASPPPPPQCANVAVWAAAAAAVAAAPTAERVRSLRTRVPVASPAGAADDGEVPVLRARALRPPSGEGGGKSSPGGGPDGPRPEWWDSRQRPLESPVLSWLRLVLPAGVAVSVYETLAEPVLVPAMLAFIAQFVHAELDEAELLDGAEV